MIAITITAKVACGVGRCKASCEAPLELEAETCDECIPTGRLVISRLRLPEGWTLDLYPRRTS